MTHRQEYLFTDIGNMVTTEPRNDTMPHKFPNGSVITHRQERLFTDLRARELDVLEEIIGNSTFAEVECTPGGIVYEPAFLEYLLYGNDNWYKEWCGAEFVCGIDAGSYPIRTEMNAYESRAGEVRRGWMSFAYDGHLLVRGGEYISEDVYFTIIPLTSVERLECYTVDYGHLLQEADDIREAGLDVPEDLNNIPKPDPVYVWQRNR